MKSIVVTYPYFHSLPKGIKMMLIASESFFFANATGKGAPRPLPQPIRNVALPAPIAPQPMISARRLSDTQMWWRN